MPTSPSRIEPLTLWGEAWRYALVAAISAVVIIGAAFEPMYSWWSLPVDIVCGIPGLVLLHWRRRYPVTIALVLTLGSVFVLSLSGPVLLALVSVATRRRWREIIPVGLAVVASGMLVSIVSGISRTRNEALIELGFNTAFTAMAVAWGMYIGSRRELLHTLVERAETAESEQSAQVERARSAERARIAREMHDVLAHRISLVALHSGALSLRTDLPPKDVREAAEVITSNAQLALTELRQVLGVLRAGSGEDDSGHLERPQPTLAQVDDLLDDARAVGTRVRVQVIGIGSLAPDGAAGDEAGVGGEGGVGGHAAARFAGTSVADALTTLSPTVSRTAYRILQEALTNARKHAPDAVVDVELSGRLGKVLTLAVTNPMAFASRAGRAEAGPRAAGAPDGAGPRATGETGTDRTAGERGVSASGLVGAGTGLAGLAERADLAGGTLDHGVEPDGFGRTIFAVRAWLPWDETVGGWRGRSGG